MHSRLFLNLCPSIIQRVTKQTPPRTITAPPAGQSVTVLREDERQAQFEKSRRHHFPRYAPIRFSYED